MVGLTGLIGLALSPVAHSQSYVAPRLVSVGGSHTCNGTGARIVATISGGSRGSSGTVTVKKNTQVWNQTFSVPANTSRNVTVVTTMNNCHASSFFQITARGTNKLAADKWVEPGVVTYKEATGPI